MNMSLKLFSAGVLVMVFMCLPPLFAADPNSLWPAPKYTVRIEKSVLIPMRDGVRLSTDLYFPESAEARLPIILIRTPYNKKQWRGGPQYWYAAHQSEAYKFAEQGYVVAVQDVRGRFESEGSFAIYAHEAEDGYDTIEWLAKQPWSIGKVGTYGCSYMGDVQMMQSRLRSPHLTAMIPQAAGSVIPERAAGLLYGGAIELAGGLDWFYNWGSKLFLRPPNGTDDHFWTSWGEFFEPQPHVPPPDYRSLFQSLPEIDILKKAGVPPSDWEAMITHPPDDPWWAQTGYVIGTDKFDAPALQVDSWYDFGVAETLYQFNLMQTNAVNERGRDNQFIVISPTPHCRSESVTQHTIIGERDLGDARFDFIGLYLRWFDHWLKGADNGVTNMPKVQIYVMGKNQWRGENEWPLKRTRFAEYYLHSAGHANSRYGDGTLSTEKPGTESPDQYEYDPASPVPSRGGQACCGDPDLATGAIDQRELEMRNDVLAYSTPPLDKGIEVTGTLETVLYVSSSARDTDFTAKLVDVYPDGTAYNLQEGIFRARYRTGWDKAVWMEPGGVYKVDINMEATSNYFAPGHRIRLEISSSNFPRFDRNLNTGGHNYDEDKWIVARNKVYHSGAQASYVRLPIIP
jgi:hypothetical protein